MKTLTFLLLFLICSHFVSGQSVPAILDSVYKIKEKDPRAALALINSALRIDSLHYYTIVERSLVYKTLEKYDSSFYDLTKAITLYPDSVYAYHLRALLFEMAGMPDESIADNTKVLEHTKDERLLISSLINRGNGKQMKRDFQGAYEDYNRALEFDTLNLDAMNCIATTLDDLNRMDECLAMLFRIIKIDSTNHYPYVNIGFQYTKLNRNKEAIGFFNKALQLKPDDPLVFNNRGFAYYNLKQYANALDDINRSIKIYPENSYAYKNRSLVYIAQKKFDLACKDLYTAVKYGFTQRYGTEVQELIKQNCNGTNN